MDRGPDLAMNGVSNLVMDSDPHLMMVGGHNNGLTGALTLCGLVAVTL